MPYLAYDRELLQALRRAMRRSSDQLAGLHSSDAQATDAIATMASCRSALDEQWLPVLDGLLGCMAMEGRTPISIDRTDLRLALMVDRQQAGWQITTDPSAQLAADTITADEALAIGRGLLDDVAVDELTSVELVWLAERLRAIAGDPAATTAFRSAFCGDDDWAAIIDRLGLDRAGQADRQVWDADDRATADRIAGLDAVIAPLAHIYAAGPHTSHAGPWSPTVLDRLDPYSAALVLRELELDPHVAAGAVDDVMMRWMNGGDGDRRWVDPLASTDNAADLLFAWLAGDPRAARLFVISAAAAPAKVFMTANSDRSVMALLAAGTDPTIMSVADAGRTIRPLFDWASTHDGPLNPDADSGVLNLRSVMAVAVGPWLLQFTARPDDWSWTPDEADGALRWTIEDETAAAQLVAATSGWQQVLANTRIFDDDGVVDRDGLADLTTLFAIMQTRLRDEELGDVADAAVLSNNAVFFAAVLLSAATPGAVVSVLADLSLSAISPTAQGWLEDLGVLPSSNDDEDSVASRFADRSMATQVVAFVAAVGQLIDAGALPPDALDDLDLTDLDDDGCAPQALTDHLNQFVLDLPTADPLTVSSLHDVVDMFGNAQSAQQQCDA